VENVDDDNKPELDSLVIHKRAMKWGLQSDWIRFEIRPDPQIIIQTADFRPRCAGKRDKSHRSWMDFNP